MDENFNNYDSYLILYNLICIKFHYNENILKYILN